MATRQIVAAAAAEALPQFRADHPGHTRLAEAVAGAPGIPEDLALEALQTLVKLEAEMYRLGHAQQDAIREVLRKARAARVIARAEGGA